VKRGRQRALNGSASLAGRKSSDRKSTGRKATGKRRGRPPGAKNKPRASGVS
jgi:hypothetical protein